MWAVEFTSKTRKQFKKLPVTVKEQAVLLINEIRLSGPVRGNWPNFSKLTAVKYHCHIKKGRLTYVACWVVKNKKIKLIEVYYVGTHEKAPY
jgi:mRNA-degrading endonuclease RelE of RelBE toxin-antitoxin system